MSPENNLEYDLRSTDWILTKARADESYAQNLYAAMCNNEFQRIEAWAILKGDVWSCSWRYAGGIVADMRCRGDYMDYYCSGIGDQAHLSQLGFVPESVVTDEIREDLAKLGWQVVDHDN
jgi:hypothetical protein